MPRPDDQNYYDIEELLILPPEGFADEFRIVLANHKTFGTHGEYLAYCFLLFTRMFYNSGLRHFLTNTSGIVMQGTIDCLRAMGEERRATILTSATMVFSGGKPPRDLNMAMNQAESFSEEQRAAIEQFEDQIDLLGYTQDDKFYEYVRNNQAEFRPPPREPPLFLIEDGVIYFPSTFPIFRKTPDA